MALARNSVEHELAIEGGIDEKAEVAVEAPGLAINRPRAKRLASEPRHQTLPLHAGRDRDPEEVEHGWGDIEVADGEIAFACEAFSRKSQDERNANQGVAQRLLVPPATVLVELLSVVGGDDDEQFVERTPAPQALEELSDLIIHVAKFSIVGAARWRLAQSR